MSSINKNGPFMRLPAELRLMIYDWMFPEEVVFLYAIRGTLHKAQEAQYPAGDYLGILTTCRAIHAESEAVLYNNTEFSIAFRDRYWLHLMDAKVYETTFGRWYGHKPGRRQWVLENPWLQDPRSIVSLKKVRKLFLAVVISRSAEARRWTWTKQLQNTLRGASNLRKLTVMLFAPESVRTGPLLDQNQTDIALSIIGNTVRCGGTVTAMMSVSIAEFDFDPAGYYRMVDAIKAVDKTDDDILEDMDVIKMEYHDANRELENQATLLDSFNRRLHAMTNHGLENDLYRSIEVMNERNRIRKRIEHLCYMKSWRIERIASLEHLRTILNERRETYLRTVQSAEEVESVIEPTTPYDTWSLEEFWQAIDMSI